jgi:hypothetical protein
MASPLRSVADHMAQQNSYGNWDMWFEGKTTATTAATTNSGSVSSGKVLPTITVPTMTSPVTGAYLMNFNCVSPTTAAKFVLARETSMGVLTISGNSFADGSSMGTGKFYDHTSRAAGSSTTLATYMPLLVVTTVLSATSPVITITYVNQAGTGSRTCTMTIPTNAAVNSTFLMAPHLQSGDTGIQDITNMSTSGGTSGALTVFGLIPLAVAELTQTATDSGFNPIISPTANYLIQGGDTLALYRLGTTAAGSQLFHAVFSPES